ncbi:MAG: hypothetical protein PHT62_04130 [Desulfotomaculaceae bacterium]|nr:hypothetical protein [Desulfotomaculaceae bacterium]
MYKACRGMSGLEDRKVRLEILGGRAVSPQLLLLKQDPGQIKTLQKANATAKNCMQ